MIPAPRADEWESVVSQWRKFYGYGPETAVHIDAVVELAGARVAVWLEPLGSCIRIGGRGIDLADAQWSIIRQVRELTRKEDDNLETWLSLSAVAQ